MKKIAWRLAGVAMASSILVVSGVAFAHGHPADHHHGDQRHQVIHGVFESGSLTGPSIIVKTSKGQTFTIALTSTTRVSLEAQGTVNTIMTALQNHQLAVTADVQSGTQGMVATQIEAHLNAKGSGDHHSGKDHHKKSDH